MREWVLSVPKRLRILLYRDGTAPHIDAVAFFQGFGSRLNGHVHLHVCVVDGVFEAVVGDADADAPDVAQVQAELRKRILQILNRIGVDSEPPQIAPARGPPL